MKILIMYKSWVGYLPRFVEEGKKRGAEVTLVHFTDLSLRTGQDLRSTIVRVKGMDIKEFDLVYVRSVGKYHEELTLLADYCKTHNIKLLERTLKEGNVDRDHKSYEALKLLAAGLGYPKSYFSSPAKIMSHLRRENTWPVVIKPTGGKRGRAVYLVRDLETAEKIFQGRVKLNYVVQDYIENDGEYRVWVIGGKLFGAMHRPVRTGGFEIVGMTGQSKKVELNEAMAKLAVRAAEVLEVDAAGIDMVRDKKTGTPYVLEVNRAAVFGIFERKTGLNVVGAIMEWLTQQVSTS